MLLLLGGGGGGGLLLAAVLAKVGFRVCSAIDYHRYHPTPACSVQTRAAAGKSAMFSQSRKRPLLEM